MTYELFYFVIINFWKCFQNSNNVINTNKSSFKKIFVSIFGICYELQRDCLKISICWKTKNQIVIKQSINNERLWEANLWPVWFFFFLIKSTYTIYIYWLLWFVIHILRMFSKSPKSLKLKKVNFRNLFLFLKIY